MAPDAPEDSPTSPPTHPRYPAGASSERCSGGGGRRSLVLTKKPRLNIDPRMCEWSLYEEVVSSRSCPFRVGAPRLPVPMHRWPCQSLLRAAIGSTKAILPIHLPSILLLRRRAHISPCGVSASALLAAFESSQPGSEAQRGKSKSALGGPRITGESRHREEGAKNDVNSADALPEDGPRSWKSLNATHHLWGLMHLFCYFSLKASFYVVFIAIMWILLGWNRVKGLFPAYSTHSIPTTVTLVN